MTDLSFKIEIYGNVIHHEYVEDLIADSNKKIELHGKFNSDTDILNKLSGRPIGVFLGWDDPSGTGLNSIASPNKFFTYVNMGIPIILGGKLSSLRKMVEDFDSGIVVNSQKEFENALIRINNNYRFYVNGMRFLKSDLDESYLAGSIAKFLGSVCTDKLL
jgi:hypothetical protein